MQTRFKNPRERASGHSWFLEVGRNEEPEEGAGRLRGCGFGVGGPAHLPGRRVNGRVRSRKVF